MKNSLNKMVNNLYTATQKSKVNEIAKNYKEENIADDKNHLLNYRILAVAIEDNIVNLTEKQVEEFYELENDEWLGEIDFVIANIITTLSKLVNKDIKTEYENALSLDKNQPEFEYLVNEVEKYLSSN